MKKKKLVYATTLIILVLILTNSCKKSETEASVPTTVTDISGNVYHTVTIGTQVWMVENLKTTKYRNGDPIPNVTDGTEWEALNTGAYCDFDNTPSNGNIYGKLYNYYTVIDSRNIAPAGWHVPTDEEWHTLVLTVDAGALLITGYESSMAGGKLKEIETTHWTFPNTGATNEIGFTALPGSNRGGNGAFNQVGTYGYWWSASESNATSAWSRYMYYNNDNVSRHYYNKSSGFSVRCIKD